MQLYVMFWSNGMVRMAWATSLDEAVSLAQTSPQNAAPEGKPERYQMFRAPEKSGLIRVPEELRVPVG